MPMSIHEQLKRHEGFVAKPYKCSEGVLTIGYGCNIEQGITERVAEAILVAQVSAVQLELLTEFEWYRHLDDVRRDVITNMTFNLGLKGFSKFKRMIRAIEQYDVDGVIYEMMDSKWAHQVGQRSHELADQWLTGKYKED